MNGNFGKGKAGKPRKRNTGKQRAVKAHNDAQRQRDRQRGAKARGMQKAMPIGTYGQFVKALSDPSKADRSEGAINKRLQSKSPWYQSIECPIRGGDVKIPDDCGLETGTVMYTQRVQHSTNAQGVVGLRISSPYLNSCNNGVSTDGCNYQVTDVAAALTNVTWTGIQVGANSEPFAIASDFKPLVQGHRVVSAAVYAQPLTNFTQNQGDGVAFIKPWRYVTAQPWDSYVNDYASAVLPNNTDQGLVVRWTPINFNRQSYTDFYSANFASIGSGTADAPYWEMGILFNYEAAANVPVLFTIVVNYEFVPLANIINILDASVSPTDLTEEELVVDWAAQLPKGDTVSPEVIGTSPGVEETQSIEQPEDSGLPWSDMAMNVLEEMIPIALEAGAALLL